MNETNQTADKRDKKPVDKPVRRKTAQWRIVVRWMIPLFLIIALIGGMIVGYVVLGKQSFSEVFEWKTWKHVFDLVFAP
ncbi:DNA-directed RNA polymerase subunit beta [Paenibacillus pini]|uniref:DNA-directed RNA polymerase subunit beta n=1 Tax=Paenibacillus pini JCM 16418 TaxID=1236976 RepID=W7Z0L9_9BACL|nr:DNA-directed RNA polymerase subunit beta [Paenibacillus pini]GAF10521.1 hypothetical protein JCM16418_4731 [Paenibacillus pini JCM 16418]